MIRMALSAAAAALALISAPANATEFLVNFSSNTNSALDGTDGNARIFSTTSGGKTLNVRATAWDFNGLYLQNAFLGQYTGGLGVTNDYESGGSNTHTVDNQTGYDFILFQFDQSVQLESATFNPYPVGGTMRDTDAEIGWGTSPVAWNQSLNLDDQFSTSLTNLLTGLTQSPGTSAGGTRTFALGNAAGNLWLVGAATPNPDSTYDAFKISNITVKTVAVTPALPEPGTWAMMLVGFGAVGYSMRKRRTRATVSFA